MAYSECVSVYVKIQQLGSIFVYWTLGLHEAHFFSFDFANSTCKECHPKSRSMLNHVYQISHIVRWGQNLSKSKQVFKVKNVNKIFPKNSPREQSKNDVYQQLSIKSENYKYVK